MTSCDEEAAVEDDDNEIELNWKGWVKSTNHVNGRWKGGGERMKEIRAGCVHKLTQSASGDVREVLKTAL